jgi:hypothetical protein
MQSSSNSHETLFHVKVFDAAFLHLQAQACRLYLMQGSHMSTFPTTAQQELFLFSS